MEKFFYIKTVLWSLDIPHLEKEKNPKENKLIHCSTFYQDFEHAKRLLNYEFATCGCCGKITS